MEDLDRLLERLTQADCVGYCGDAPAVVVEELGRLGATADRADDGSVHGVIPGRGGEHMMLGCHIDEIGFVVQTVEDNGFIRFSDVGRHDARIVPGQEVRIWGKEVVRGYVALKPPHLITPAEQKQVLGVDRLFIDTGLPAERVKELVRVGDLAVCAGPYRKLQNDLRSAKALDNRASVAACLLVMKDMAAAMPWCSVHFVATSQEETTGLGAKVFSYKLPLRSAVVLDVTFGDQPELGETECYPLGKGPAIGRGATIPPRLYERLVATARSLEIPYQIEALPSSTGTDADAIAFNREGIPTAVVGIPLRYMHTPVEVVSLKDIERAARLVTAYIRGLEKTG